jgi:hypothetical protein
VRTGLWLARESEEEMKTYTPEAMRERAVAASNRIGERLARLWKPTPFERFDGSQVLCATYAEWQDEVERFEFESGGFTPKAVRDVR